MPQTASWLCMPSAERQWSVNIEVYATLSTPTCGRASPLENEAGKMQKGKEIFQLDVGERTLNRTSWGPAFCLLSPDLIHFLSHSNHICEMNTLCGWPFKYSTSIYNTSHGSRGIVVGIFVKVLPYHTDTHTHLEFCMPTGSLPSDSQKSYDRYSVSIYVVY